MPVCGLSVRGTNAYKIDSSSFCATSRNGLEIFWKINIGRATRSAQNSGDRTANVFGATSQPTTSTTNNDGNSTNKSQCSHGAAHSAIATMAAFAKVFPRTIVASRCCGSDNNRATNPPLPGCSASCRNCHFPSENSADSASAKKKLMPAKISKPVIATYGVNAIGGIMNQPSPPKKAKLAASKLLVAFTFLFRSFMPLPCIFGLTRFDQV